MEIQFFRQVLIIVNIFLFQLFLLHIDDIVSPMCGKEPYGGFMGSTSVICDQENKVVLGHSQDFSADAINHCYVISVHIMEAAPKGK